MDYVIYRAQTPKTAFIRMTSNPKLDFAYFSKSSPTVRFEVLTAGMDINKAYYIMSKINKNFGHFKRIVYRRHNSINYDILSGLARGASLSVGAKWLRAPVSITKGFDTPDSYDEDKLYNIIKGRLVSYRSIDGFVKDNHIFLKHGISDILQILYLKGKLLILPEFIIDRYHKKIECIYCGEKQAQTSSPKKCSGCSRLLDFKEPVFASPYILPSPSKLHIFKDAANLDSPQRYASLEMCEFIKGNKEECIMWMASDQEDIRIFLKSINHVLNNGGRVLICVPCLNAAKSVADTLSPYYSSHVFAKDDVLGFWKSDIDIALFRVLGCFYSSYDLIILFEPPSCSLYTAGDLKKLAKRALKPCGKMIFASSTLDYKLYKDRESGKVCFEVLPIRKDGMIFPEPRVLTYKRLSESNVFMPDEVMDFIRWSNLKGRGLRIITPSASASCSIGEMIKPLNMNNIKIETYPSTFYMNSRNENLIVFFADKREVFNEKALLNILMLPPEHRSLGNRFGSPYEVIFVGAHETEEMHNARIMLRQFNKKAWEMGYIKENDHGKNI